MAEHAVIARMEEGFHGDEEETPGDIDRAHSSGEDPAFHWAGKETGR